MAEQAYPSLSGIYGGEAFEEAAFGEPDLHPSLKQLAALAVRHTKGVVGEVDGPWAITRLVEPWTTAIEDIKDSNLHQLLDPNEEDRLGFLAKIFPGVSFEDTNVAPSSIAYARIADVMSWGERRVMRPYGQFALERIGPWNKEDLFRAVGIATNRSAEATRHGSKNFANGLLIRASHIGDAAQELILQRDSPLEAIEAAVPTFAKLKRAKRKQYRYADVRHFPLAPIEVRREALLASIEDSCANAQTPFDRVEDIKYLDAKKTIVAPWFELLEDIAGGAWDVHRANTLLGKAVQGCEPLHREDTQRFTWFLSEFIFWYKHTGNQLSTTGTFFSTSGSVDNKIASLLSYIKKEKLAVISAQYYNNTELPTVSNRLFGMADTARFFEPRLSRALNEHPHDTQTAYLPSNTSPKSSKISPPINVVQPPLPMPPKQETREAPEIQQAPPSLEDAVANYLDLEKISTTLPEAIAHVLRTQYYKYPVLSLSTAERELARQIFGTQRRTDEKITPGISIADICDARNLDADAGQLVAAQQVINEAAAFITKIRLHRSR